jgi:glutamate-1-semialdehyde aminotransferase
VPGGVVGGGVPGGVVGGGVPGGVVGGSVSVGRTSTVSVNASSGACGTERGLAVSITLVKPASNPVATIPAQITTINRGMRDAPCRFSTRLRL